MNFSIVGSEWVWLEPIFYSVLFCFQILDFLRIFLWLAIILTTFITSWLCWKLTLGLISKWMNKWTNSFSDLLIFAHIFWYSFLYWWGVLAAQIMILISNFHSWDLFLAIVRHAKVKNRNEDMPRCQIQTWHWQKRKNLDFAFAISPVKWHQKRRTDREFTQARSILKLKQGQRHQK